jgi:hypothetical protein
MKHKTRTADIISTAKKVQIPTSEQIAESTQVMNTQEA